LVRVLDQRQGRHLLVLEQVTTLPLIKHADQNGKDWLR